MSNDFSPFEILASEIDDDRHDRFVAEAQAKVAHLHPFLFQAATTAEFDDRLALVGERIETVPENVRGEVVALLRAEFVARKPKTAEHARIYLDYHGGKDHYTFENSDGDRANISESQAKKLLADPRENVKLVDMRSDLIKSKAAYGEQFWHMVDKEWYFQDEPQAYPGESYRFIIVKQMNGDRYGVVDKEIGEVVSGPMSRWEAMSAAERYSANPRLSPAAPDFNDWSGTIFEDAAEKRRKKNPRQIPAAKVAGDERREYRGSELDALHAEIIKQLIETNNDQPEYDEASAQAAIDSMVDEGKGVEEIARSLGINPGQYLSAKVAADTSIMALLNKAQVIVEDADSGGGQKGVPAWKELPGQRVEAGGRSGTIVELAKKLPGVMPVSNGYGIQIDAAKPHVKSAALEGVDRFVELAKEGGWSVSVRRESSGSAYLISVERNFTPGDAAAYAKAENEANRMLGLAPMKYPGSVWGTDSASVGGHVGLTGGYMHLNKSGVGAQFARAVAKVLGLNIGALGSKQARRGDDIVGYAFKADTYCPDHIMAALPTGPGEAYDGWKNVGDPMDVEDDLDEIAMAFGIDRQNESSFDSDEFPKVIFRDQVIDAEGDNIFDEDAGSGRDHCATCNKDLATVGSKKTAGPFDELPTNAVNDIWAGIDEATAKAREVKTIDALFKFMAPPSSGDAFWMGDGDELLGALYDAGWQSEEYRAPYLWALRTPDGKEVLSYVEGDLYRGQRSVLSVRVMRLWRDGRRLFETQYLGVGSHHQAAIELFEAVNTEKIEMPPKSWSKPERCRRCGKEYPGGGYCTGTKENPHPEVKIYAHNASKMNVAVRLGDGIEVVEMRKSASVRDGKGVWVDGERFVVDEMQVVSFGDWMENNPFDDSNNPFTPAGDDQNPDQSGAVDTEPVHPADTEPSSTGAGSTDDMTRQRTPLGRRIRGMLRRKIASSPGYQALEGNFTPDYSDEHDPWGHVMLWSFAVAGVLYLMGESVPSEWQFNPGLGAQQGEAPEDYPDSLVWEMTETNEVTAEDLVEFGNYLAGERDRLEAAGRSY